LRPHGPNSFTVTVDGERRSVFWTIEDLGADRYRFEPVFPAGGHQPFEVQGELVRQPRQAHYVVWAEGKIQEGMADVEESA